MAELVIRRASRGDLLAVTGESRVSAEAYVGLVDGKPIAAGGLFFERGRVFAFCDLTPAARQHGFALHRMAVRVMRAARESGYRYVFAQRDTQEPTALHWLMRLGFRCVDGEGRLMLWRARDQDAVTKDPRPGGERAGRLGERSELRRTG